MIKDVVPSSINSARSGAEAARILSSVNDLYKYGKSASKYYSKYKKAKSYIKDLADSDTRSVAIAQIGYDAAVAVISDILGTAAKPYLSLYCPYMKIAFSAVKMLEIGTNASQFLQEAIRISEKQSAAILGEVGEFARGKQAFGEFESAGNTLLVGIWLSRDLFNEASIKANPQAVLQAIFALKGASDRLDKARSGMDKLIALLAHNAQTRSNVIVKFNEYNLRVEKLEHARGLVPSSLGTIMRNMDAISYMQRTGQPGGISRKRLAEPFDKIEATIESILNDWVAQDQRFEDGIFKLWQDQS